MLIHSPHRSTGLVIGIPERGFKNTDDLKESRRESKSKTCEHTEVRRGVLLANKKSILLFEALLIISNFSGIEIESGFQSDDVLNAEVPLHP